MPTSSSSPSTPRRRGPTARAGSRSTTTGCAPRSAQRAAPRPLGGPGRQPRGCPCPRHSTSARGSRSSGAISRWQLTVRGDGTLEADGVVPSLIRWEGAAHPSGASARRGRAPSRRWSWSHPRAERGPARAQRALGLAPPVCAGLAPEDHRGDSELLSGSADAAQQRADPVTGARSVGRAGVRAPRARARRGALPGSSATRASGSTSRGAMARPRSSCAPPTPGESPVRVDRGNGGSTARYGW